MKFQLTELIRTLSGYENQINIINNNGMYINSVELYDESVSSHTLTTLYILKCSDGIKDLDKRNSLNLIAICEKDSTIADCLLSDISEILYNTQKINSDIATLTEALYSGKGLKHIVDVASNLLGNPFFIRETSFKISAYTSNVTIDDDIWNDTTQKGYQDYNSFLFLLNKGYLDRANKHDEPIIHQFEINEDNVYGKELVKKDIFNEDYIVLIIKSTPIKKVLPRVWNKITYGNKFFGYMVTIEAYKKFTAYDISLIRKISEIIAIEMNNRNIPDNTIIQKQNNIIYELLDGKINDPDNLKSKIKISGLTFSKYLKVVVLETGQVTADELPLNYIKGFFVNSFKNVFSVFYEGYYFAIISSEKDYVINETQMTKLKTFSKDIKMLCGISRTFTGLLDTRLNFQQAVESINSGKRTNPDQNIFNYENVVMQHIISICEKEAPLKSFCLPNLDKLKIYDTSKGTDFYNTLHYFANKFNNPTELAKDLNLHRNTLYYRIKKIEEILDIDLNNTDTLFRVYFSFKILEYMGLDNEK